jgi:hypothetical protein
VRAPSDVVEEFVSRIGAEFPKSREWLRSHPEYVRDAKLNRKMLRAHEDAMDDGIKADTPEYFQAIERTLGITKPPTNGSGASHDDPMADAATEVTPTPEQKPQRRAAPAAAPVSRSGGGTGSRPNTVRLTPQEVEMAEMMDMSLEEYARNKVALQKEGKLN